MLLFSNQVARPLCVLAVLLSCLCCKLQTASAESPRPNVVLIMADDWGWGELNANFDSRPFGRVLVTPNLDTLAAGGLRFTNFYSCGTVCTPSRMSFLTGYETNRSLSRGNAETVLRPESVTIGHVMQDASYTTHAFGKWGVGGVQRQTVQYVDPPPVLQNAFAMPTAQGFHSYAGIVDTRHAWNYWSSYIWQGDPNNPISPVTIAGNVGVDPATGPTPAQAANAVNMEDVFRDGAIDVIDNWTVGSDPFFIFVPFITPHRTIAGLPIDPLYATAGEPGDLLNPNGGDWPTIERQYASAITAFDQRIGDIVQALLDKDILDDTLILITGDNGPQQTEGHQVAFFDSGGGLRGFKRAMYEGGIRTPMVAYWNGTVAPGVSDFIGTHADYMPSLAELAGGTWPADIDGISFAEHLLGGPVPTRDKPIYFEFYEGGFVQAARNENWKIVRTAAGAYELYDLSVDPGETNDLAANPSFTSVRDQMITFLEDTRNYTLQYQPHYSQDAYETIEDTGGIGGVREFELRLAGDAVRVGPGMGDPAVSAYPDFSHAIQFSGSGTAHSKGAGVGGEAGGKTVNQLAFGSAGATTHSASFELWFQPDDLVGSEILAELGGVTRGSSLLLDDSQLKFRVKDVANVATISVALGSGAGTPGEGVFGLSEFNQVVGVVDIVAGGANIRLYLNGVKMDEHFLAGLTQWAGGDGDALGGIRNTLAGNNGDLDLFGGFNGKIAMFRVYEFALADHQVMQRYLQIATTASPSSTVEAAYVIHNSYTGTGSKVDIGKILHKETAIPTLLSYSNLINTSHGINGIGFEVAGLEAHLTEDDFEFRRSPEGIFSENANPPGDWELVPETPNIDVTLGSPSEIAITWPDGTIMNRWLQITVKATANTGLTEPEVYYIGHVLGETTGVSGGVYTVSFADITPIRSAVGQTVDVSSIQDIDKNGIVNFADISAMRANVGAQLTNISVPAAP